MTSADRPQLDDAAVAAYLGRNTDFFTRHPDLLAEMDVRQQSGGAVSLVERQVAVLRQRSDNERRQLHELLATARNNDITFARTRKLTLALMDAANEADLDGALARNLVAEFAADDAVCFGRGWSLPNSLAHLVGVGTKAEPPLPWLFERNEPACAVFRPEEYAELFRGTVIDGPGSVATVPVVSCSCRAVLAIGARDPHRFSADMDDVFLRYIGEVLARTIVRLGL